jgi:4'-phosphopantetheinyl transferase
MRSIELARLPEAPAWAPPPARPTVAAGEVHLWRAALDRPPGQIEALASLLSGDEAERAARFRFRRDRDRYVAARGLLRTILGRCLGAEPARLRFSYVCVCGDSTCLPERRKPALAPEWAGAAIRFNLSHADDLAVYAVARDSEVGVDLECLRADIDYAEVATYSLTTDEAAAVRSLPRARQPAAFLAIWTRKEAYLKGRGVGLTAPEPWIVQRPRDAAAGSAESGDEMIGPSWRLRPVPVEPGYVAALAVDGPIERIARWDLAGWMTGMG